MLRFGWILFSRLFSTAPPNFIRIRNVRAELECRKVRMLVCNYFAYFYSAFSCNCALLFLLLLLSMNPTKIRKTLAKKFQVGTAEKTMSRLFDSMILIIILGSFGCQHRIHGQGKIETHKSMLLHAISIYLFLKWFIKLNSILLQPPNHIIFIIHYNVSRINFLPSIN